MIVKAKQGCMCPRENPRDKAINDTDAVEVPDTAYYRRRVADGSLRRVAAMAKDNKADKPAETAPAKKESK